MRWRVVIFLSLALNVAFAAAWLISHSRNSGGHLVNSAQAAQPSTNQVKTIPVYRKQFFSWREVESEDYPTYIANLRDIGCPEATIHDIIIADVNQLYARKKATDVVTANQQWWRSDPDTNALAAAAEKSRALDEEKQALLTRLLGPGWNNSEETAASVPKPRSNLTLDGPVLGVLPDDVKESIQQITAQSRERVQAYLNTQRAQGKQPDAAELARIRQQTRNDLAAILPPAQLEEFLLRYSENATNLRKELGQLKYFNPSPEEFRNVFRATDPVDQQIQLLSGKDDPNSIQQRNVLVQQRDAAIKSALGPQRYAEYLRLQDASYREAYAIAQQYNASPQSVPYIVEINRESADEKVRITGATNLTPEQKAIALKQIELEQLKAQAEASGVELPPSTQPAQRPPPPKRVHTISAGEDIGRVSLIYGIAAAEIRDANPGVDFTRLKPGDSIFLPPSLNAR